MRKQEGKGELRGRMRRTGIMGVARGGAGEAVIAWCGQPGASRVRQQGPVKIPVAPPIQGA